MEVKQRQKFDGGLCLSLLCYRCRHRQIMDAKLMSRFGEREKSINILHTTESFRSTKAEMKF
jgi:hypothetical protein